MNKSIKWKLVISVLGVVLICFFIMTALIAQTVGNQTQQSVVHQSEVMTNEMANSMSRFMTNYESSVTQLAKSAEVEKLVPGDAGEEKQLRTLFSDYLESYHLVSSVYYAFETKDIFIEPKVDLGTDYNPLIRDWYKEAKASPDQTVWTLPYVDLATNELIVSAVKAIKKDGQVIGVVGSDISYATMTKELQQTELDYEGFPVLLDQANNLIVHGKQSGDEIKTTPSYIKKLADQKEKAGSFELHDKGEDYLVVYNTLASTNWKVATVYKKSDLNIAAFNVLKIIIVMSIITFVILAAFVTWIMTRILKPLENIQHGVNEVANGDLTFDLAYKSDNELGSLANDFRKMVDKIQHLMHTIKHSSDEVDGQSQHLNALTEEVQAASEEVNAAMSQIAIFAAQSNEQTAQIEGQVAEWSGRLQEMEQQMNSMLKVTAQTAQQSIEGRDEVIHLQQALDVSQEQITQMATAIQTLDTKIQSIHEVMNVIQTISEQTSLLALNASIEAARAGEHGKGFAVVAHEVQQLAAQSNQATEDVRQTIEQLQKDARNAGQTMKETLNSFNNQATRVKTTSSVFLTMEQDLQELVEDIHQMADTMKEMAHYKEDISAAMHQLMLNTSQTTEACGQVSLSSNDQIHAISDVALATEKLTALSKSLQNEMTQFKTQ